MGKSGVQTLLWFFVLLTLESTNPLSQKVKVSLLADIHFLVASLLLEMPAHDMVDIVPRALRAFRKFLVDSPAILSEEELADMPSEEKVAAFQS